MMIFLGYKAAYLNESKFQGSATPHLTTFGGVLIYPEGGVVIAEEECRGIEKNVVISSLKMMMKKF